MNPWLILFIAIVAEVIGTTALRASANFTRVLPSVLVLLGYGLAFYMMSLALNKIPLGTTYAVWSGVGTVGTAIIGVMLFKEILDLPKILGIGLIVAGVVVLNVFTKTH